MVLIKNTELTVENARKALCALETGMITRDLDVTAVSKLALRHYIVSQVYGNVNVEDGDAWNTFVTEMAKEQIKCDSSHKYLEN